MNNIDLENKNRNQFLIKTNLISFSSLTASFFCFSHSSEFLRALASSLTARSLSRRKLSHSVRILSLSCTVLSISLKAQSRRLVATMASCSASKQTEITCCQYNSTRVTNDSKINKQRELTALDRHNTNNKGHNNTDLNHLW